MLRKALLTLTFILFASSAWAQNSTCPTRPVGDNSNACASTAFVQNAVQFTQVTPEQCGYTTYGSGDAGPAINTCINSISGPVRINFGPHQYNIVTPILITKDYVWLQGVGPGSVLYYTPSSNNTAMITWHDAARVVPLNFGRITDFLILSPDHTFTKTAINLIDIGDMEVSGLYFAVWNDAGFTSKCLQTNGRQTSSFHDLRIFCDRPIVLLSNPNSGLAADHFHFWNLYLSPVDSRPSIEATGILFTNTTFDGFQAWVGGSYGFYYDGTGAVGRGTNLSFYNVRCEDNPTGVATPADYCLYLNVVAGIGNVIIQGTKLDEGRQGIYARGILNLNISGCYYPPVSPASMKFLDADTTDLSVTVSGCRFESGVIQSLGGLATVYGFKAPSTSPIATDAFYASTATGTPILASQMPALTGDVTTIAGALATTLATVNSNVGSFGTTTQVPQFTVNGKGLITAAANVAIASTTVNGQTCTPGSSCTIAASATSITVGVSGTTVVSGTTTRVLFDNAGTLGEYAISGTGNVAMTTSPTFVTPALGTVASGSISATFLSGTLQAAQFPALTGDITTTAGSLATALKTIPGLTASGGGSATTSLIFTWDANGRITTAATATITPAIGSITGLATNCGTWLATSTSANLASCVTDETGTAGTLVFSGSPTITTPTFTTSFTGPIHYGGSATGSIATVNGTSNGSPSSAYVLLQSGTTQFVGINNATPKASLDINNNTSSSPALIVATSVSRQQSADTVNGGMEWVTYGSANGNFLTGAVSGGTSASPTATPALRNMFNLSGWGYTGSAWAKGAIIAMQTPSLWSGSNQATQIDFYTTPTGSTTLTLVGSILPSGGLLMGSGSSPTAGQIAAQNGFIANNLAGINKTCTIAVGNVLTFTLGILTATSGAAGCV